MFSVLLYILCRTETWAMKMEDLQDLEMTEKNDYRVCDGV